MVGVLNIINTVSVGGGVNFYADVISEGWRLVY